MLVTFGQYNGKTLEQIAEVDLLYLDWLVGERWFWTKFPELARATGVICRARVFEITRLLDEQEDRELETENA